MDALLIPLVRSDVGVRCLLRALELSDGGHSYAHSWRVGRGVARIAELVGWETPVRERAVVAALLHDIGKVFVRREVLTKPCALDAEERFEIQRHPRYGFEVVRYLDAHVAQLLIAHHECAWHPEGMEGLNYPRAGQRRRDGERRRIARILVRERRHADRRADDSALRPYRMAIAVSDVLDALASERWYKTPWESDAIRRVLHVHFPIIPDIADALLVHRAELQRPVPELREVM